jgi:DNA-directed RNA polymerase specialized sigma24 family protein
LRDKNKNTRRENMPSNSKDSYVTKKDLELLFNKFEQNLKEKYSLEHKEDENAVPAEIFADKLSPSEAVVKYLKENKQKTYREIAVILKRDERGIWGSYRRSLKKLRAPFEIAEPQISIPLITLSDRRLSILEAVVFHLKEVVGKRGTEISRLLNKSPTTISTVYLRAKNKIRKRGAKK